MPTIKRKVEMNLPQLIEWLFRKNNLDDEIFLSNQHNRVQVTDDGILEFFGTFYNDTFTVEIEEEITEDTAIHSLIELSDKGLLGRTILNINRSINLAKTDESVAFYILNDDLTMTLIWTKEEGLVE